MRRCVQTGSCTESVFLTGARARAARSASRIIIDVYHPNIRVVLLDVVFVVDCSGSMAGERIGALNWAMKTVLPAMRAHAEEHPEIAIRIRVLRFATGASFAAPAAQPIETFAWDSLVAGGESDEEPERARHRRRSSKREAAVRGAMTVTCARRAPADG